MTSSLPLFWTTHLREALIDAKQIPLHGFSPPFPWEEASSALSQFLEIPSLKISSRKSQFLPAGELTSGLGNHPIVITLELAPIVGQLFFVMGRGDVETLSSLLLTKSQMAKGFISSQLQEGFYYFLAQKSVHALNQSYSLRDLSLAMGVMKTIPEEEGFCIDVEISLFQHTFWARVICPLSFHHAFKQYFSTQPPLISPSSIAENIALSLSLIIGKTSLSLSQWKQVSIGDFLLLDQSSFDPKTQKGTAFLHLEHHPLFQIRLKGKKATVVDYAFYHEEIQTMSIDPPGPEKEPEEEPLSFEEPIEQDPPTEEENHLWAPKSEPPHPSEGASIPVSEIPVTITVEVDRIAMTLDRLLQLSPGNVLELSTTPSQGVTLTIGGKRVAKGELIQIGELIGVKILNIN